MELSNAHRGEFELRRRARGLLLPLAPEHPHLSYEQLEALAEGRLTARGIAGAHARQCRICRNELGDLTAFVRSFRAAEPVTKRSWLENVRGWFERPMQLAGALATVAAVTAGLYLFQAESQRVVSGGLENR